MEKVRGSNMHPGLIVDNNLLAVCPQFKVPGVDFIGCFQICISVIVCDIQDPGIRYYRGWGN